MLIGIAGAHGQIARQLAKQLVDRGDEVRGVIRNPDHIPQLQAIGVSPVLCDLENVDPRELQEVWTDCDAVVFAAGAGPGSGIERKYTVDQDAAVLCAKTAQAANVPKYLLISSMGANRAPAGEDVFSHYLRAKHAAEQCVYKADLDWVILRPGRLTNSAPSGLVRLEPKVPRSEIPRADVAAVVAALLRSSIHHQVLELTSGQVPIRDAVGRLGA